MSTEEREKQIREREAKATKGPWRDFLGEKYVTGESVRGHDGYLHEANIFKAKNPHNRSFLAHARADIPWLLSQLEDWRSAAHYNLTRHLEEQECRVANQDAVRRLESELEELRREIEAFKKGRI